MYDDLAWLALENAVYEKELPERPALAELRQAHAAAFLPRNTSFPDRSGWRKPASIRASNPPAESCARTKAACAGALGKGLSAALSCPGTLSGEALTDAIREAFRKYLRFDGTAHAKAVHPPFRGRWVPLLTKLFTTEMIRTDDLAIDRSAAAKTAWCGRQCASRTAESGDRENESGLCARLFHCQSVSPRGGADRTATLPKNHLGCHLWFTRGETAQGKTMCADVQHLFDQAVNRPNGTVQISSKTMTCIKLHPAADRAHPQLHAGAAAAECCFRPTGTCR